MRLERTKTYAAFIDDAELVHDGDTIDGVIIKLDGLSASAGEDGEVFPDVFAMDGEVYAHIDIRISGIDAPEMTPRHRLSSGQLRSDAERAHEKTLALKARQIVVDLLSAANLHFEVRNPQQGKYASRLVAEIWCKDASGELVNVGLRLLQYGLAYRYSGGRKRVWTLDDGPLGKIKTGGTS